eukprot:COSAG01_NODE_71889_length_254_cov_1.045161_1_plen_22_part_10
MITSPVLWCALLQALDRFPERV